MYVTWERFTVRHLLSVVIKQLVIQRPQRTRQGPSALQPRRNSTCWNYRGKQRAGCNDCLHGTWHLPAGRQFKWHTQTKTSSATISVVTRTLRNIRGFFFFPAKRQSAGLNAVFLKNWKFNTVTHRQLLDWQLIHQSVPAVRCNYVPEEVQNFPRRSAFLERKSFPISSFCTTNYTGLFWNRTWDLTVTGRRWLTAWAQKLVHFPCVKCCQPFSARTCESRNI
jgi:hypothetical protein